MCICICVCEQYQFAYLCGASEIPIINTLDVIISFELAS